MNQSTLVIVAAVALVAGAGAAAWYQAARLPGTPPPSPDSAGAVTEAAPLTLAATLPSISLPDREGIVRSLDHWQGRSLIVNFWATWCAPCRREIPLLEQLQAVHAAEGFQVIGVAVDYRDKVLAYAEEMKIGYPLLIGEQEALDAAAAFGVDVIGLPFTVFSDNQGRIIAAHMGELTEAEAGVILGAVRQVNGGVLTPQQAKAQIQLGLGALPKPTQES